MEPRPANTEEPKRYLLDGQYRTEAEIRQIAGRGEKGFHELGFKTRKIVELLKGYTGRMLDVGCHLGELVGFLGRERPELDPLGVDYFEDYIEMAKMLRPDMAERFRVMDVYDLDFPDEHFDVVTMVDVIEHLKSPFEALSGVRRVMKPGAVLITSTPNLLNFSTIKTGVALGYYNRLMTLLKRPTRLGYDIFFENEEWNRHIYSWTPHTLNTMLKTAGFAYSYHTTVGGGILSRLVPGLARELIIVSLKEPGATGTGQAP